MAIHVPISRTKVVLPSRRAELISRPRLLESLQSAIDHKLTLVSAAAGYGKTSLLIDFAHQTALPVCWLSLDHLDRDPQHFLASLAASFAQRFPALRDPVQPLIEQIHSIETDLEAVIAAFTNEIYDRVAGDFLFVIDDYHLIDDAPMISALTTHFLNLVDDSCHVIICSRVPPSLPNLSLMIAREQVDGLGQADLAFLPAEIQAFFASIHRKAISTAQALELADENAGWITGIILANQVGATRAARPDTYAYLSDQVLNQQRPDVREFLLRISLPDEFNYDLCERLLVPLYEGKQDWFSLIREILTMNLFVVPVGNGREEWFRFHPLFGEFLRERFSVERPQEFATLLRELTQVYGSMGEWEKAYYACMQLNDPELLANVVEMSGAAMLKRASTTLEAWLDRLPPSVSRKRPGLISIRGAIAITKGDLRTAINLLDTAELKFREEQNVDGVTLALVRRAFANRILGRYAESLRDADLALELTEPLLSLQSIYAEALRVKGQCLIRLGKARAAIEYLARAHALVSTSGDGENSPALLMEIGLAELALGEIASAKAHFEDASRAWEAAKDFFSLADLMNNIANLYHQTGGYESALDSLQRGLSYAKQSRHRRAEALILLTLGDLYEEIGENESAGLAYQRADPIIREFPGSFIDIYLALARTNLAVSKGNLPEADSALAIAQAKLAESESVYERGLCQLIEGRLWLTHGRPRNAVLALRDCPDQFSADGRAVEIAASRVWLAAAFHQVRDDDAAREQIREVLARSGQPHAMLLAFLRARPWLDGMERDQEIGPILRIAFEDVGAMVKKMPAIRRRLRRVADTIHLASPGLSFKAFGKPNVLVEGRAVTTAEWSTQSVRDLLFYFLEQRQAVTKEQIAAGLWPEIEDPQLIKQRFKAYVFRLRRATRRDVIVFDEDRYVFNHTLDYEYDVDAFESYLQRARGSINFDEQLEFYERAASLVAGPYLADVDGAWALAERNRLEQAHLGGLEALASLYLNDNQFERVVATCMRILKTDSYREGAYRLLMHAYAARGRKVNVVQQYEACKAALWELGLIPSEETTNLYQSLLV